MGIAKYFQTYWGRKYYRDQYGNIYTTIDDEIFYCSNLKRGRLNDDKAEPSYTVNDITLAD